VTSNGDIVLEASGISKVFPGVQALDDVSIELRAGRLTALLGENGAGKSTLMNIVAGVLAPDSGEIRLAGKPVRFANPRDALDAGIAMIFQELNLVSNLTVAENIFLGREPRTRLGFVDFAKMNQHAAELLEQLDLGVKPTRPLGELRVGQQQVVEIAKAISYHSRVLIMDEPTSAITEHEIEVLFGIVDRLKRQGVAIAYITHKLEELSRIGDDAIVMRDGKLVASASLASLTHGEVVRLMVGRETKARRERPAIDGVDEVLRVDQLALAHPDRPEDFLLRDISFSVCRGEVLGIFGLMGAGRTELLETIFGLHSHASSGTLVVDDNVVEFESPADAIAHGLALAPEDRKREGLVLGMTVAENASLACLPWIDRHGVIDRSAEKDLVDDIIARFRVKTPSHSQTIRNLSGGNQQKVILGKWIATKPKVLLLDEPTRGIDVNAKEEIHSLIHELSASGLAVIVVSSELPEILAISDRIVVMCEGRKTGEFTRLAANEELLMKAALPKSVAR
jgi:ribose transport system ATP-binding protein